MANGIFIDEYDLWGKVFYQAITLSKTMEYSPNDEMLDVFRERAMDMPRIQEVQACNSEIGFLLAVPNLPERPEGFIHGPDILQSVAEGVTEHLNAPVVGIESVQFLKPTRRNNLLFVTRDPRGIDRSNAQAVGSFRTQKGIYHFSLLSDLGPFVSPPITAPMAILPQFVSPPHYSTLPQAQISQGVSLKLGANGAKAPLVITEAILAASHQLMEGFEKFLKSQLGDFGQAYFTSLRNLDLSQFKADSRYDITISVREIVPREKASFMNCTYLIRDWSGQVLSQGMVSYGFEK
ncbi:MAG: hypothetical protein ACD_28C00151G0013 [uncultured bacterium]|nr:MAG: hypothetical protein ACD_28C00151G0013 [uncultured bacterium]